MYIVLREVFNLYLNIFHSAVKLGNGISHGNTF